MDSTIQLRPLRKNDAAAYYQIVKHESVAQGAQFQTVESFSQAQRMLEEDLQAGQSYAICL